MIRTKVVVFLMFFSISLGGCAGLVKDDDAIRLHKRAAIQQMRQETLVELYKKVPHTRQEIKSSYGYAVFSNIGIHVLVLSTGHGSGVARNNRTGQDTYMKMFSAGAGIGAGIKDFRGIFIFDNKSAFERFLNRGWAASAQADAAVELGEIGGSRERAGTIAPGVRLYQLTENGLAAQITIQGTKYWKDDDLN